MQRIVEVDYVDQALEIQDYLLRHHGIEASIYEIQKKYYRFCGWCGAWTNIHCIDHDEDCEPKKTFLQTFCEWIDKNLLDD